MANLLTEYRKRHKSGFVWACFNGVCFFSLNDEPAAVCLVSEVVHGLTICEECDGNSKDKLVIDCVKIVHEISYPHVHVAVGTDLKDLSFLSDLTPFESSRPLDHEIWLWNFYLKFSNPFSKDLEWRAIKHNPINEMLWAAVNRSHIYLQYFNNFFKTYLLGRKYLLRS